MPKAAAARAPIGIAVAILDAQAENSFATLAYLGDGAQVDARGLDIHANTRKADATVTVIVGAGAILGGGGRAQGTAKTNGSTDAHIGAGANVTVTDGVTAVHADADSVAAVDVLIATASVLVTGRDAIATVETKTTTVAYIGEGAILTTRNVGTGTGNTLGNPGDVLVRAIASAEGDAKAESYGGAIVASGDSARATTTVEPAVRAWTGAGTRVDAAGAVQIIATYQPAGAPPSTEIIAVDTTNDTLQIDVGLTLRDGNIDLDRRHTVTELRRARGQPRRDPARKRVRRAPTSTPHATRSRSPPTTTSPTATS